MLIALIWYTYLGKLNRQSVLRFGLEFITFRFQNLKKSHSLHRKRFFLDIHNEISVFHEKECMHYAVNRVHLILLILHLVYTVYCFNTVWKCSVDRHVYTDISELKGFVLKFLMSVYLEIDKYIYNGNWEYRTVSGRAWSSSFLGFS